MTGDGNWTWLIPGRIATLVDAGTGEAAHLEALREALGPSVLGQVVVTHAHTDHASGVPAIAARVPSARFRKMLWPERDAKWPAPYEPLSDGDIIDGGEGPTLGKKAAPDREGAADIARRKQRIGSRP